MPTLHIYNDENTSGDRAATTRSLPPPVMTAGCSSILALNNALAQAARSGLLFNAVIFDTHGAPGLIGFGPRDDVTVGYWLHSAEVFGKRLCAQGAHVLFTGCNVAAGEDGWAFLEGAGRFFLREAGGSVTGWTSVGFADIFFGSGHTAHFWGRTRTVTCDTRGRMIRRTEG